MKKNKLIIFMLLSVFLFSCGGKKVTKGDETAEELYQMATTELNKKTSRFPSFIRGTDYNKIFKVLKELQLKYTFSQYATLAELRTADAYYKKEEFEQASVEYESFINRHPGHKEVPYATYRLALSHYQLRRGYDRDPTNTRAALKWFNVYMENYPDAPEMEDVKKRIMRCRTILARHEIYIARYYESRNNPKAAAERYKVVTTDYPDTKALEESLFHMGKNYYEANELEPAKEALQRITNEFPNTKYRGEAAALLSNIEKKEMDNTKSELQQ